MDSGGSSKRENVVPHSINQPAHANFAPRRGLATIVYFSLFMKAPDKKIHKMNNGVYEVLQNWDLNESIFVDFKHFDKYLPTNCKNMKPKTSLW